MSDEDESELGQDLVDEELLVETLMGWDGEPCRCRKCACPRFRESADEERCPECAQGRHWHGYSESGGLG